MERIEAHVFSCAACTQLLADVIACGAVSPR
jgi:hypothetical protein